MKKLFITIIALIFSYTFFGCSTGNEIEKKEQKETVSVKATESVSSQITETIKNVDFKPPPIFVSVSLDTAKSGLFVTENKDTVQVKLKTDQTGNAIADISIKQSIKHAEERQTQTIINSNKFVDSNSNKTNKTESKVSRASPLLTIKEIVIGTIVLILFVSGIWFVKKYWWRNGS